MKKEILKKLLNKGLTTHQISNNCKCSQTTVMYWLRVYSLESKHKTHNRKPIIKKKCLNCNNIIIGNRHKIYYSKYCGSKCWQESIYKRYINRWLKGKETGNHKNNLQISAYVRKWILVRANNKCEKCGWNKINPFTKKCPLTVHHIDGNSEKTTPENLEAICPNCHSLTGTYGGLNKGNGRKARYMRR